MPTSRIVRNLKKGRFYPALTRRTIDVVFIWINTRSRTFSLYLGLLFTGVAVGPTLGSLVIRYTHEVISAFELALAMHLLYTFVVWFIVPESLFPRQLARAHRNYANSKAVTSVATRFSLRRLFIFVAPLRIFVPAYTDNSRPFKRRLDWNLTLLSAAYCFAIMMMVNKSF
jgi:hypothetical protein